MWRSNKRQRQLMRVIHLSLGSMFGLLVYGPPELTEGLRVAVQVVGFPVLALTGMWLWWGASLVARLHQHRSQRQRAP